MTPERLAEIRQFAEAYKGAGLVRRRPNSAIAHRGELLAEIDRLTATQDKALTAVSSLKRQSQHEANSPVSATLWDAALLVEKALIPPPANPGKWTAPDGTVYDVTRDLTDREGTRWRPHTPGHVTMLAVVYDDGRVAGCSYEIATVWDASGPFTQAPDGEPR